MSKIGKEYIDDLTGLWNRRYLKKVAITGIKNARKNKIALSILLIDLDHFKNINDTFGHAHGDKVLKEFGGFLKNVLRQDDMVFRYGGDEFVCILPHADYQLAIRISRRFIEKCRKLEFSRIRVTMSIGIASFPQNAKNWSSLFEIADRNLYSAKRHGRDRVGIFEKEKKRLIIPAEDFIGRESEMERIKELIKPVRRGNGNAVSISGEMGIGKTRLVHEVVKNILRDEISFLETNLSATTRSIPYYPFREIIRTVINEEGKESIKHIPGAYRVELGKIIPELWAEVPKSDKQVLMIDKFRLFEGVRKYLEWLSARQVLFIFLDNVHWADSNSLELFHYLVRTLRKNAVLFIFTYRIEEVKDSSLPSVLPLMVREGLYEEITLGPLQRGNISQMLLLILGTMPSSRLVEYIEKETGGNSFFIEEIMKGLEANDALVWKDGDWLFDESKNVSIPYSVEGVVDRRLHMLSDEARTLLEYAVVIGREFDFSLLKHVTEMNEGHLFDLIDEILEVRLLKEQHGNYRFIEDIIREVIYCKLSEGRLTRYHKVVGNKLWSYYRGRHDEVVEELALHFYTGGDCVRAVEFSMRAADRAKDVYANKDSVRFYSWALESMDDLVENRTLKEIECLKKRAEILQQIGENDRSISDLNSAINRAQQQQYKQEEADCLIRLCTVYDSIAQNELVMEKAKAALAIYQEIANRKGEAKSLQQIGIAHHRLGNFQKALGFYRKSLVINKGIGARGGEAGNYNAIGLIHCNRGEYRKALKFFQNSHIIHEKIGDCKGKALDYNNIGGVHFNLGEYDEALEYCQNSLKINEEVGDREGEATNLNNMGSICVHVSEFQKALKYLNKALKINEECCERRGMTLCLNNIGNVHNSRGDYKKALECYKIALENATDIGDRFGEVISLSGLGNSSLELNDLSDAEKYFKKAGVITRQLGSSILLAHDALNTATLYIEKEDITKARRAMKKLSSFEEERKSKTTDAMYQFLSGRLSTKQQDWNEAKSSFRKALLLLKNSKKRYDLAKVYYYQGMMFKEMNDKKSAQQSFKKAKALFKVIGATGWLKKIVSM